jgi:hypothetical protein
MTLLYGIAAVALVWWLSNKFAQTNAAAVAKAMKVVGGILAAGAAVVLALRGRVDMALLLGSAAGWLLGWSAFRLPGFAQGAKPTPGNVSRVRTAMIEMELDHDSGKMDGTVLVGALAGQRLDGLDEGLLRQLRRECLSADPDGVRLLEAYFDRRFPRWRENAQGDDHPRPGGDAPSGPMTEQEAYQILGLEAGASLDEIRKAHRTLMKKLHPDQGGSTYLAARVNQAKEILLSRHR